MRKTDQLKNIFFSILMANFNNANYIETAINSVLKQTYTNWELIVIDDCSGDDSVKIIKPYLRDKRIKLIKLRKNLGYGGSLKTAADNASNQILAILDADDKLHETALEVMLKTYKDSPDCGFVYSTMWRCDAQLKNCSIVDWIGPSITKKTNIFNIRISHFKTFLKDAYMKTPGFDPNQKKAVDKDIIFKLEEVTELKYVDIPLYYYRWHGRGISQDKSHYVAEFYHYLAKLKAYKRRKNSTIPNFTQKQIKFEYYRIVFYKISHLMIFVYRKLKIPVIIKGILKNIPSIQPMFLKKLEFLRKMN